MAYDPQAMQNAVSTVVTTAWANVKPPAGGGCYFVNQIFRTSFEQATVPADGGKFPIAVIWLRPAVDEEWGLTNEAMGAEMTIFYADLVTLDDAAVWAKVTALHPVLFAASDGDDLAGLQVHRMTGQSVDPTNEALAFFLNRDVPYTAGSVSFRCLYGESSL